MRKRALLLTGGTMRGAFIVGALKSVYKLLGVNYFDAIFSTSVGVFEQAFFAAGQPNIMENTWREYVHGRQLINFMNPLKGKPILDLDYLVDIFQSDKSRLNISAMQKSHPKLFTFVADYETKEPALIDLKNGSIFDIMRATSALYFFYPKKVVINNKRYVDSNIVSPDKLQEFIKDSLKGYEEIIIISTSPKDNGLNGIINIIKPSKMPLWGALDTNKNRIIQTIKQGEIDTEKFIIENNLLQGAIPAVL